MQEWKKQEQISGVGKAGVNCMEQDYTEKILSYVELENAGADRTAYMTINDKNCNLPIVLTAMDKKTAKII